MRVAVGIACPVDRAVESRKLVGYVVTASVDEQTHG